MTNFILQSLIWILAIYGFIEIVKIIIYTFSKVNAKSDGIYIIVAVKNQEEKVECFLRSFLFRIMYGKEDYRDDIMFVDLDSRDSTKKILENFEKDYNIAVLDWRTCKNKIEEQIK